MIRRINIVSMILATSMLLTQSFIVADNLGHALGANGYLNNMPLYYKKWVRSKPRRCKSCNPCKHRPIQCQKKRVVGSTTRKKSQLMAHALHHNHMKLAHTINQLPANNTPAYQN